MKNQIYIIILLGTLFLAPVPYVQAETDSFTVDTHGTLLECDNKIRENHLYLMNAEKLGLTAEQIKELRDIKGDCDKLCIADKVRLRVAKVGLSKILKSKDLDMTVAKEKIMEISALQDSLRVRHLKTRVKAIMILNEEQKEQARAFSNSF